MGLTFGKVEEAIVEARGTDPNLSTKLVWLRERWGSKRYQRVGEETPLMYTILFKQVEPIHAAVVADNLDYFRSHYRYNPETLNLFLNEACMCGSQNIAEYLLKESQSSYKEHPDLLAYISASMCVEWAKEVAFILAQEKLPIPKDLYRLADSSTLEAVVEIFETEKKRYSRSSFM